MNTRDPWLARSCEHEPCNQPSSMIALTCGTHPSTSSSQQNLQQKAVAHQPNIRPSRRRAPATPKNRTASALYRQHGRTDGRCSDPRLHSPHPHPTSKGCPESRIPDVEEERRTEDGSAGASKVQLQTMAVGGPLQARRPDREAASVPAREASPLVGRRCAGTWGLGGKMSTRCTSRPPGGGGDGRKRSSQAH